MKFRISLGLLQAAASVLAGMALPATAQNAPPAVTNAPAKLPSVLVTGKKPAPPQLNPTDPIDLNRVDETSSRLGVPLREVPASAFVLDPNFFKVRGSRTALEAIENVVGISGVNSPGNGTTYSSRGFAGDAVAQLFDGVRIINPAMSARPLDTFNLQAIEIIKGPASVLHGEGSVGATINYLPKNPSRDRFTSEALVSYGSWNTVRLGAGIGGPVGDSGLSYRADFSRQASDTFQRGGGYELFNLSSALRYDISETLAITLYAEALKDDITANFGVPLENGRLNRSLSRVNYNVSDAVMSSETYWLRLKTEWTPNESFRVRNLTYGLIADRDWRNAEGYDFDPAAGTVRFRELGLLKHEQSLIGNRFEGLWTSELAGRENRFAFGADLKRTVFFRLADFSGGGGVVNAFRPQGITYLGAGGPATPTTQGADYCLLQSGLFLEDQFAVLPSLKLVGGLRYDYISNEAENKDNAAFNGTRDFHPVSYRGGLVWEPIVNTTVYGQFGTAANSPRSFVNPGGAQAFALEQSRQFEIGLKHSSWSNRFEATLAAFHLERDRLRAFRSGALRVTEPAGEQVSRGVELELAVQPVAGWWFGGNATVIDAKINRPGFAEDRTRPSNVPRIAAGMFTRYQFPSGIELGFDVRHLGQRLGNDPSGPRFSMESATLLGAYAAYDWKQFRFSIRGRNLTDRRYLSWAEDDYGNQAIVGEPLSAEVAVSFKF